MASLYDTRGEFIIGGVAVPDGFAALVFPDGPLRDAVRHERVFPTAQRALTAAATMVDGMAP